MCGDREGVTSTVHAFRMLIVLADRTFSQGRSQQENSREAPIEALFSLFRGAESAPGQGGGGGRSLPSRPPPLRRVASKLTPPSKAKLHKNDTQTKIFRGGNALLANRSKLLPLPAALTLCLGWYGCKRSCSYLLKNTISAVINES